MDRIDLIKALAGRRKAEGAPNPRGLAHPGEVATKPVKCPKYTPMGGYGRLAPEIENPEHRRMEWVKRADPEPEVREACRHELHPLTRIAKQWIEKRGW